MRLLFPGPIDSGCVERGVDFFAAVRYVADNEGLEKRTARTMGESQNTELVGALRQGIATRKSDFLVIVPTYNEIENIQKLIHRIKSDVEVSIEVLVVDDNSPDGTAEKVLEIQKTTPNLHLMKRSGKMGLGSAYLSGFHAAFDAGFAYVITMDSDLSHAPEVINDMAAQIGQCDLVIGSRYVHGGKIIDFQLWRTVLSRGGNLLARTLLGLKTRDCSSGFRCYRCAVLSSADVEKAVVSRRYIFLVELLFCLSRRGCRIQEVPIIFINRVEGKTKVNMREMVAGLWTIVTLSITERLLKRM